MRQSSIDHGKFFDWGKTAKDYAQYRDIYPERLYQTLYDYGIGQKGQQVLDLGTGTGVLPRNMYKYGAAYTGADISPEQIQEARRLSQEKYMQVRYLVSPAEDIDFPAETFDAVTACQCFFYFHHTLLAPKLHTLLKPEGKLAVVYMAWLPAEDPIAGESEKLVLQYNPDWTGKEEYRHPPHIAAIYDRYFTTETEQIFDVRIPFTRESWAGRIRACRGVGAALSKEQAAEFDAEHKKLLEKIAPASFEILHYCAISILKKRRCSS